MNLEFDLLKKLCRIHAPSGNELNMKEFIVEYVHSQQNKWLQKPEIIAGENMQDCLILAFGKHPKVAVFAHMDSVGFTVRYFNQLVPIGQPEIQSGYALVGHDSFGPIECKLVVDENNHLFHDFGRPIETGTELVFKSEFKENKQSVQTCYLDNRLGVYNALKQAETLENGLLVFSCWEEHGGGSVPFLARMMYEKFQIQKVLISDITWVTDGVFPGKGVAISMRDRNIPRRSFLDKIIQLADEAGIDYQLEVEAAGSSDGREIQQSPYPMDWCFIGAAETNVHSPREKVDKKDIQSMIQLYQHLLKVL